MDVLKVWSSVDVVTDDITLTNLWENLRALFLGNLDKLSLSGVSFEPVLEELDRESLWKEFLRAVSWRFDHGEIDGLRQQLLSALRSDSRTLAVLDSVPLEYLVKVIVVEVIEKAGRSDVEMRRFDRLSFARLVAHATLTLHVEKAGAVDFYNSYVYVEMLRGDMFVLCLLRLPSIEFIETETVAFLALIDAELQGLGCTGVNSLGDALELPEAILKLSSWLRMLPIAIYVSVLKSSSKVEIARSNLSRTVGFEIGLLSDFFSNVTQRHDEYSECSNGSLTNFYCTFHPNVLSVAKVVGRIVESRLLKEVGGPTRLYESIRYKVQVAISPDSEVFSEPNRPLPW